MAIINPIGNALTGITGSGNFVGSNSPTLVTPNLGVASATSINFGGNALSNYISESTWTATFTFATPGDLSVVYVAQTGYYTRIGSVVYYQCVFACTPTFTTASGNMIIGGLPLAGIVQVPGSILVVEGLLFGTGVTMLTPYTENATTTLQIYGSGTASAGGFLTTASCVSGATISIRLAGFYFV